MAKGIIYVLSNEAFKEGYYKIGRCKEGHLEQRLKDLNRTNVPLPFTCEYAKVVDDFENVERHLHIAFASERQNPSREFFSTTPERIAAILELLPGRVITGEVEENFERELEPDDRVALERARHGNLDFLEIGIPVGGHIVFTPQKGPHAGEEMSAEIVSRRKVMWNDKEYFLTPLTNEILGLPEKHPIRPAIHWKYNGTLLAVMYDEYIAGQDTGDADALSQVSANPV